MGYDSPAKEILHCQLCGFKALGEGGMRMHMKWHDKPPVRKGWHLKNSWRTDTLCSKCVEPLYKTKLSKGLWCQFCCEFKH